jgi:hypothetical protein
MPKKEFGGQVFTVRPDRVDFRDFPYHPPLRSLPAEYPDLNRFQAYVQQYMADGMVLQQGDYGACTGFGLAGVINYLKWEAALVEYEALGKQPAASSKQLSKWQAPPRVSESMLYLNARLYDEWPGDDYEGSSCRGAMKGWHKHGVCLGSTWPYKNKPGRPKSVKWRDEATETVLGAYYRIDAKSIVDMQASIREIHAVYVAAEAHDGWTRLGNCKTWSQAVIGPEKNRKDRGGHAFAMVGYTPTGFIIQNSWGPDWGYCGFALLTYADWIENGYDTWALALGAPIKSKDIQSPIGQSRLSLQERVRGPAGWSFLGGGKKEQPDLPDGVTAWNDDDVTSHVVVSTVDGAPVRQIPSTLSAPESVQIVARAALEEAKQRHSRDIAIILHGGLNGKDEGFVRAGFMGPWFQANDIVPIFPVWQTDGGTSLLHAALEALGLDELAKWVLARGPSAKPDDNALDRHVEDVARHSPGKAAWSEMKNKAQGLSETGGALRILIAEIAKGAPNDLAIHLVGHSAGAIVAGHALAALKSQGLKTKTVTLYAPACTAEFANATFAKHLESGYLKKGSLHIDYLSDRREQLDPCVRKLGVTLYSKSLLYLVSRAFEPQHKTPILGLERVLTHSKEQIERDDAFYKGLIGTAMTWQTKAAAGQVSMKSWDSDVVPVTTGKTARENVTQVNVHGAFDNNVECVNATIQRIRGAVKVPVRDLDFGGG